MRLSLWPTLALGPVLGAAVPLASLEAQTSQIDDAAYVTYGRRDGLPDAPILSLRLEQSGYLVAGTSNGVFRFNGRGWEPESLPPMLPRREYRDVLEAPDNKRYYVHSYGAVVRQNDRWMRAASLPTELSPIYSSVLWRDSAGHTSLIVGAAGGVFRLIDDARFERIALPNSMSPVDAMVDVSRSRDSHTEDVLWVGTRGGGVARRTNGGWTQWSVQHGLHSLAVEHVAAAPAGDHVEAIVATQGGAFALRNDRWTSVGPQQHLSRALRVFSNGRGETWLGALSGELYRGVDGSPFTLVELSGRTRGSRAQVLRAVSHDSERTTVYAGFRSGSLVRFLIGGAGRLNVPSAWVGHPVTAMARTMRPGDNGFWGWMLGVGAVHFPDLRTYGTGDVFLEGGDGRVRIMPLQSSGRLLLSVEWRLFEHVGNEWKKIFELGRGDYIYALVELPTPNGGMRPVVVGGRGAWFLEADNRTVPWEGFPEGIVSVLHDTTRGAPHPIIGVTRNGDVHRSDGLRWSPVSLPVRPSGSLIRSATLAKLTGGETLLLMGTGGGVNAVRLSGGPAQWKRFDADDLWALQGREVLDLKTLPNGLIAAGTPDGLMLINPGASLEEPAHIVSSFTEADGLPHAYVSAIGGVDEQRRLWVGTTLGVGVVPLATMQATRRPPRMLGLSLNDGADRAIANATQIPFEDNRFDLTVFATSYHRDLDMRYRIELDGRRLHAAEWTDRATHTQLSLPTGEHRLRVQAMDYDGRLSEVLERRFTVLPPWWRSPLALTSYAVLMLAIGTAVVQWRTRGARRRVLEAEANERRLSISEERFRRLFEDGVNPQLLVLDGVVWKANATAEALLGAGSPLSGAHMKHLLPCYPAGDPSDADVWRRELDGRTLHGEVLPLEVRRTRIPLELGTLEHLELLDLRERKRLEQERRDLETHLRESQRLESVGTLAGGVAHDFNNLLTVIQTNAELAEGEIDPSSPAADSINQVLVASRRARDVVRQILTFSRKTPPRRAEIHFVDLLEETLTLLRSTIPSTVTLVVDNAATDAWVHGDATQLQQLLLNLCANAEHAMRSTQGGVLTIALQWSDDAQRLSPEQPTLILAVQDTGSGMTEAVRARAFEPFFTTKPVGEGTGLGLSVLHGIVGAHGGDVTLTSSPGAGTVVSIRLPARNTRQGQPTQPTPPASSIVPDRQRLLVVDDETAIAQVLQRTLVRRGFEVEIAANGAEALSRMLQQPSIEVLITDQTMPVMTGADLIARVRESGNACPIVLMSGFGAAISDERLAPYADVHRIDKPFAIDDLLRLIRRN
ncbi:MAG: response regulator [Gemmatimonadaceae bacterium]|nr:response regulator [Gemmatimonadaceae bacterium]